MSYSEFLASKSLAVTSTGIDAPTELHASLFPFQRDITRWALRRARAALFEECGLGKSRQAIEWARCVSEHTSGNVLVLTPLAVAEQFVREGASIGVRVTHCRERGDVLPGINVTNYERFERFDPKAFSGVVLDESSILKAKDGKTRNALIHAWRETPFRLACTATPAPNDHQELGNHAEFLGVMTQAEMLSMFFVHDGGETQKWRLKGHAERDFWRWVCSWAVCLTRPSGLGYSDDGYDLPPLNVHEHVIESDGAMAREAGMLFAFQAKTLDEQRAARRASLGARVARAAELVNGDREQWLVWCDLNDESKALAAAIPDAVEVTGSDSDTFKEDAIAAFTGIMCQCEFHRRHGRKSARITNDGATQTASTCAPTPAARPSSATPNGGLDTPQKSPSGSGLEHRLASGSDEIPRSDSLNGSSRLESQSTSSRKSSRHKGAGAQSAVEPNQKTTPSVRPTADEGSTSTTVTSPGESGGSSAQAATSGSESSPTVLSYSSEQRCTCGGQPIRVIVSKPAIFAWGVNLQGSHKSAFVGLSHSFEAWYQATRRQWRFGQRSAVDSHIITSSAEGAVLASIQRKREAFEAMVRGMSEHMADVTRAELASVSRDSGKYCPDKAMRLPSWLQRGAA